MADFVISYTEQFHLQPEVLYAHVDEGSFLYVPILFKFYVSGSAKGFHFLAGPEIVYAFNASKATKGFGLNLSLGAGFDLTEPFLLMPDIAFRSTTV